ncbi:hypothetical protein N0V88_002520 [Collariella sp. IMI 366227]|nr:hypothetical protein N0V88_002520 [Collariella sp. IMI 366227]
MEYWPRKGRPMLLAALEAVCDAVEDDLTLALAEISANRKLRPLNTTPADGCPEDKPNYEKEYLKVLRKYAALEARYEENQRKGRQFREARDGWMKYAQSIEAKMEKLEKKLQTKETADDQLPREPQPVETAAGAGLSGQTALDPSFTSDPGADAAPGLPKNPAREPTDQITAQALPASITEHAARAPNEDTDDGSEGASELPPLPPNMHPDPVVKIKQEPSSDPVIISEKPLRKRKHADDAGALTPLRRIKTESSGSSGLMITGEAPTFCPHESIDLDDEERGMPTPWKQRQAAQQQLREENLPSSEDDPPFELHHAASRSVQHVASTRDSVSNTRPVLSSLSTNKPARSDKDGRSPIKANWTLRSGLADVAEDSFGERKERGW